MLSEMHITGNGGNTSSDVDKRRVERSSGRMLVGKFGQSNIFLN